MYVCICTLEKYIHIATLIMFFCFSSIFPCINGWCSGLCLCSLRPIDWRCFLIFKSKKNNNKINAFWIEKHSNPLWSGISVHQQCVPVSLTALCVCVCPLPCVCVSGSLFRGLLRSRLSGFFPPGLLTPPPEPTDPSDGACDLLLHHKTKICKSI